ncbi:MAG TPA: hypothetical protein VGC45_05835 [Gryllotalpicola sp.]
MTDVSMRPGTDASAFGRRAAALLAARSDHLPRVRDVTVLGPRRELELEAVTGPTLGGLLARRRHLATAEALTVMIGVVRAVGALHGAGYCGVDLGGDGVRFDVAGRPVVLALGPLQEVIRRGSEGPADDWRAVAALADRLGIIAHGRVGGALGPAHVGLGLALAALTAGESGQNVDRLEEALFELAEPVPVRLDAAAEPVPPGSPLATRRTGAAHRRPSASALIEAFDAGPAALLAGPLGGFRARAAALAGRVQGRGRMLVVAGAFVAALVVVAVTLLPGEASEERAQPAAVVAAPVGTAPSPAPEPSRERASGKEPRSPGPPIADDPVAAVSALLARRDACLPLAAPQRAVCFSEIADAQASALDMPARPLAALTPSLLERTGDSALIALTPKDAKTAPASVLLMRTEAGWKLRQLYEN